MKYLSPAEAARRIGTSLSTMIRMIKRGDIPEADVLETGPTKREKHRKHWVIPEDALEHIRARLKPEGRPQIYKGYNPNDEPPLVPAEFLDQLSPEALRDGVEKYLEWAAAKKARELADEAAARGSIETITAKGSSDNGNGEASPDPDAGMVKPA